MQNKQHLILMFLRISQSNGSCHNHYIKKERYFILRQFIKMQRKTRNVLTNSHYTYTGVAHIKKSYITYTLIGLYSISVL